MTSAETKSVGVEQCSFLSRPACFFRNWQSAQFMEVEVAIRLLYMLGEALPASHGAHFSGNMAKTSALQDMMRTVSLGLLPQSLAAHGCLQLTCFV